MLELKVENMTCGGCARRVTKSVQALDGNAKVEVDLAAKKLRVDSSADPQALVAAVTEAGYPATLCKLA